MLRASVKPAAGGGPQLIGAMLNTIGPAAVVVVVGAATVEVDGAGVVAVVVDGLVGDGLDVQLPRIKEAIIKIINKAPKVPMCLKPFFILINLTSYLFCYLICVIFKNLPGKFA